MVLPNSFQTRRVFKRLLVANNTLVKEQLIEKVGKNEDSFLKKSKYKEGEYGAKVSKWKT